MNPSRAFTLGSSLAALKTWHCRSSDWGSENSKRHVSGKRPKETLQVIPYQLYIISVAVDHFPYEIVIFCGSLGPVVVSSAHPVGVFTVLTMADLVPTILLAHLPIVLAMNFQAFKCYTQKSPSMRVPVFSSSFYHVLSFNSAIQPVSSSLSILAAVDPVLFQLLEKLLDKST
jgi:hypothetical protein